MENKEELKQRIENAERELAGMKELLDQSTWNISNVNVGDVFVAPQNLPCVIVATKFGFRKEEKRYSIAGYDGDPFQVFSTLENVSFQAILDYLNEHGHSKAGKLETNFKELTRDC